MNTTNQASPKFDFKVWGPIIIWSLMFLIAFIIKLIAFKDFDVFFDIAPEATLWASGVLFTIAESDMVFTKAKISPRYKRKAGIIGYEMDYEIELPEKYDPRDHVIFLYLFVIALVAWVLNLFISNLAMITYSVAQQNGDSIIVPLAYYFITIFLATIMIVLALRSTRNVSK